MIRVRSPTNLAQLALEAVKGTHLSNSSTSTVAQTGLRADLKSPFFLTPAKDFPCREKDKNPDNAH